MRKATTILLLSILLLAACSNSGAKRAAAPPAQPGANPTGPGDEVAVDRVLAALDGVMGDLQRLLVRERRITPEITDRLQAIYTGPELLNQIDAFRVDVDNGLTGYRSPPGNRVTVMSRLITAGPDCVFAEVKRDYSASSTGPARPPATLYVILVPKRPADDPKSYNPTGWAMLYDGVQEDGSQPGDVCR